MRILYIIHSLNIGGAETVVTNYLLKLKQYGHHVALLQFSESDTFLYNVLKKSGIPVYSVFEQFNKKLSYKIKRKFKLRLKVNYIIKKFLPDVIHIHTNCKFIDKLYFDYGKVFFTFHTSVDRALVYPTRNFRTHLINACDKGMHLIVLSEKMKDDVNTGLGVCDVTVIPNGEDIEEIGNNKINKSVFLEEFDINNDAFIVGHVGRFHPVKNHEKVISVFEEVHRRHPNSYLILIGNGEQKRIEQLNLIIKKYELENNIIFLGAREDAKKIISIFDCAILPSFTEGFSLFCVECQVHGVRTVVTDAVPDEVVINDNCFKLSICQSDSIWADYVLGNFTVTRGRKISELDINNAIKKHLELYGRYI